VVVVVVGAWVSKVGREGGAFRKVPFLVRVV